ncbi:MOSC domain-containing protein [Lacrimispora sp. 210928-DFI.3.58]|uniref:MOSC domain-containing protein n=1 Tax=Lacrimispora sp. 210928-DFI.3.58 TaxID=2883214 RepID=UPI001D091212|nr:MOSC domain-containing protein [Lacrimispora sp. 210928-DFI.3.58]MCB7317297.1 MOSC domain-containing protein [Lacrimispora sp. 210928-DFI.3.58]
MLDENSNKKAEAVAGQEVCPGQGVVRAVCISEKKGVEKHSVPEGHFLVNFGIEGDAHAGNWHRQVSLLSYDKVEAFNQRGANVEDGAFGENLVVAGLDFRSMPVGTRLYAGTVELEMTQIGKECHSHCAIYKRMGECIMPREGVFAKVLKEGVIRPGDVMRAEPPAADRPFTAAVITLSDKGARGERKDESGPAAKEMLEQAGYDVVELLLLPDEPAQLKTQLIRLADSRQVDLVLTSGGTGFSLRDQTPEATMAVADRNAPGIAEAIRYKSMAVTDRAMLSRGVSVLRKGTLIVNLPGSPKAVRESLGFILDSLDHGLKILRGSASECARR